MLDIESSTERTLSNVHAAGRGLQIAVKQPKDIEVVLFLSASSLLAGVISLISTFAQTKIGRYRFKKRNQFLIILFYVWKIE
jgi:hypothetical protein